MIEKLMKITQRNVCTVTKLVLPAVSMRNAHAPLKFE